jgi:hypothetical protein
LYGKRTAHGKRVKKNAGIKLNGKFVHSSTNLLIMKKIFSVIITLLFISFNAASQTTDEIVNKHIEAMGGKEKLLQLKTMVTEGSLSVQGTDIPVKISQEHNKGQRVEITVMGMSGYIINTPTEGWQFFPFQGQAAPEAMSPEAVKESVDFLDIQNNLLDYKQKGHQVEYVGKEDFEGTECFKLKVVFKGGAEANMYIDPSTYYVIKQVTKTKSTGQEVVQDQTFSNFKKQDGYVFPFSLTGVGPGGVLTVTKIEVNKPLDASLFKAPK